MLSLIGGVLTLFAWCIGRIARSVSSSPTSDWGTTSGRVLWAFGTHTTLTLGLAAIALVPLELAMLGITRSEAAILFTIGWLYLGLISFSRAKTPVVFLRKFGFTRGSDITREAFTRHLRGTHRLVTLDDQRFAAQPFRRREAGAVLSTVVLALIAAVIAIQASCAVASQQEMARAVHESAGLRVLAWLAQFVTLAFAILGALAVAGGVAVALTLVWSNRQAVPIDDVRDLFRLEWLITRLRARVCSPAWTNPTVMVIRVAQELWQDAVATLSATGAPILIDVSRPGQGLVWEVAQLTSQRRPLTFIAETRELQAWRVTGEAPEAAELIAAIDERPILEYDADSKDAASRLAGHLRSVLQATADHKPATRLSPVLTGALYLIAAAVFWLVYS